MNRKALNTVEKYEMLKRGETVVTALSGGADSVALLAFLCSLDSLDLHIIACHVNHNLRGQESERDEKFVRDLCQRMRVPLVVESVDVAAAAAGLKSSLEAAARSVRYRIFANVCENAGGGKVATAHTLSDSMETVLFNMARGTGLQGLCGIPPVRGNIIRPLIEVTRAEVEAYLKKQGLSFVVDSTNLSDDYTRNYIRHHIIPELYQINGDASQAMGRMMEILRQENAYLEKEAQRALFSVRKDTDIIDIEKLTKLSPALYSRCIALLLKEYHVQCSTLRIQLLEDILREGKGALQVSDELIFRVRNGVLSVDRSERSSTPVPLKMQSYKKEDLNGQVFTLADGKSMKIFTMNCADYEIFDNNSESVLKYAVDYDKIMVDVFLRNRLPGDRFTPLGRGCTKTLKKLFNENKLPALQREKIGILADREGIIFIEDFGVSERVKIDHTTKTVAVIEITEDCK